MAVTRSDEIVEVRFLLDSTEYPCSVRRGQIIHEAFHAALPKSATMGHRLTFRTEEGRELFADLFIGDLVDQLNTSTIVTTAEPIASQPGEWRNIGFDHLAITVEDRAAARDFFTEVLRMKLVRDDAHLTVVTTGLSALMMFDAGMEAPLSPGIPSSWHHIGFVVDDLAAAYNSLEQNLDRISSDLTMLERNERWSLYFFYKNGSVTFMIQFSEIKEAEKGFAGSILEGFEDDLYNYASKPYYGLDILEPAGIAGQSSGL